MKPTPLRASPLMLVLGIAACDACDGPQAEALLKLTNVPECELKTDKGHSAATQIPEQVVVRIEHGKDHVEVLASNGRRTLPTSWAGKTVTVKAGTCMAPCDRPRFQATKETVVGGDERGLVIAISEVARQCPDGTMAVVR